MLLLLLAGAIAGAPPIPTAGHSGRNIRRMPPVEVDVARMLEEDDEEVIVLLAAAQAADDWS